MDDDMTTCDLNERAIYIARRVRAAVERFQNATRWRSGSGPFAGPMPGRTRRRRRIEPINAVHLWMDTEGGTHLRRKRNPAAAGNFEETDGTTDIG